MIETEARRSFLVFRPAEAVAKPLLTGGHDGGHKQKQ
jgi:hypothetical protein